MGTASTQLGSSDSVSADRAPDTAALVASLSRDAGARWALATVVLVVATSALSIAGVSPDMSTVVLALVAGGVCVGLPIMGRLATGVVAWAFLTGFVYNQYGELTFAIADLGRLAVLAAAAVTLTAVGRRSHHDV